MNQVSLAYDEVGGNAIEGVTLDIREGEFVAIVGPSGCGKSTLLKLCSGLVAPTEGIVSVLGQRVLGPLKFVGMAFQNSVLLPWRNVLDNVLLPLEIVRPHRTNFRKNRDHHVAKAKELLNSVGLHGYEDKFPWELSGGMQQRVSICRALVHDPKLLLLDEPLAALDAFTREDLWIVLRDLWQHKAFTVVLVTHDLREATFLADAVFVMSRRPGKIIWRKEITIARPRDLNVTYSEQFVALVHDMRDQIHIGKMG